MDTATTVKAMLVQIAYYAICGVIGYLGGLVAKAVIEKIAK